MQIDERDEQTWVVVEITRSGERILEEGKLEGILRQHLRCAPDHPIFIPAIVYNPDDPVDRIVLSAAEGYVFIGSGLPDHDLFRLEDLPFIRKVMTARDPATGMRVCMSVPESSLAVIRDQLTTLISSSLTSDMDVVVTHGYLTGMQGRLVSQDLTQDNIDVYFELRSLRFIRRLPKSAVRPLSLMPSRY